MAGEPVGDVHGQHQAEHRDRRAGRSSLVRENHRHVQIASNLSRDRGRHRPNVAEQTVPATAVAAREFGPGGRDHGDVDPAAVIIPHPAVHHVGAHRQADPAPRREDHERHTPGAKAECFPEDQVPLSIDVDRSRGQAKGQRIVEVLAVALDKSSGDTHAPLAAALRQVPQRRSIRSLGARAEVGKQTVARIEHFREDGELGPCPVRLPQEIVRDFEIVGSPQ